MVNNYILLNPWVDGKKKNIYKADNSLDGAKKAYSEISKNFSNNVPEFFITLQQIGSSKDLAKGSNKNYHHFKINEKRSGKNNIKFDLQEIKFNEKDNLYLDYFKKSIYKTILDINNKNKEGGRRRKSSKKSRRKSSKKSRRKSSKKRRDEYDDDDDDDDDDYDDDDDLFDDDDDIIDSILDREEDKIRRNRRRRKRDDYYEDIYDDRRYRNYSEYFGWYYSPYVYNRFLLTDSIYVPTFTVDTTPYVKVASGNNFEISNGKVTVSVQKKP